MLFALHAALLLMGLGSVQPLNGLLAYRSWRWFLFLSVITQAVKVHRPDHASPVSASAHTVWCHAPMTQALHARPGEAGGEPGCMSVHATMQVYVKQGLPRLRPFSLAALREWAAPMTATTDFQYLLYSLLFLQSKPLALVCGHCPVDTPSCMPACRQGTLLRWPSAPCSVAMLHHGTEAACQPASPVPCHRKAHLFWECPASIVRGIVHAASRCYSMLDTKHTECSLSAGGGAHLGARPVPLLCLCGSTLWRLRPVAALRRACAQHAVRLPGQHPCLIRLHLCLTLCHGPPQL